jgi:ubiquitin carboxyl-terminal hydrolase L5
MATGVFTEMLETLQVKGVELQELYSLDDDSLSRLGKVYGLIFLFQWIGSQQQEHAANKEPLSEGDIPEDLFFAHQVTTNACATQAILSVLFNAADLQSTTEDSAADDSETTTTPSLGSILSEFQSFTQSFPPALKGVAISSSDDIKKIHNSFSRQDAFLQEGKMHIPTGDEEAFHFVAYVPSHGTVYELDGLQKGPIVVGSVSDEQQEEEESKNDNSSNDNDTSSNKDQAWLSVARTAIQERMTAGGDHIKFNLMAIVQDKRIPLQQSLKSCSSKDSPEFMALQQQLDEEAAKRELWKIENQRRRHNYVPLCIQLFRELAKQGSLEQLVRDAKERNEAKRLAHKAAKAAAAASG